MFSHFAPPLRVTRAPDPTISPPVICRIQTGSVLGPRGGEANVGAPLVQPGLEGLSFDGSGAQVKIVRVHPACGVRVRGLHVADGSGHLRRSRARVARCVNLSIDEVRLRERVGGVHDEIKASEGCRRDGAGAHVAGHVGIAGGGHARLGQDGKVARGAEEDNRAWVLVHQRSRGTVGTVEVERQEQRAEGEHRTIEHRGMDALVIGFWSFPARCVTADSSTDSPTAFG
eukprot:scaffold84625_cov69-Phaeocystis_antarctica.AAC.5